MNADAGYPLITMLGDSITGRAEAANGGVDGWNVLLAGLPFRFHNAGIDGNLATDVVNRLGSDVKGARTLLMIGVNDLSLGTPVEDIDRAVEEIVRWHREREKWIALQTVLPTAWEDLNDSVRKLNAAYAERCAAGSIPLIDSWSAFMRDGEPLKECFPDGVHLSRQGYEHWAVFLRGELKRCLQV